MLNDLRLLLGIRWLRTLERGTLYINKLSNWLHVLSLGGDTLRADDIGTDDILDIRLVNIDGAALLRSLLGGSQTLEDGADIRILIDVESALLRLNNEEVARTRDGGSRKLNSRHVVSFYICMCQ